MKYYMQHTSKQILCIHISVYIHYVEMEDNVKYVTLI